MNKVTSVEFRKTYPKLGEPTQVLAYGRVIGVWTPVGFPEEVLQKNQTLGDQEVSQPSGPPDLHQYSKALNPIGAMTQAQRDQALRKMTKGTK